jgi:hypothetical protein
MPGFGFPHLFGGVKPWFGFPHLSGGPKPWFGFPHFMPAVEEVALSISKQPMAIAVAAKPPRRVTIEVISPSFRPALGVLITVFIYVYFYPFFWGAERLSCLFQFVLVIAALVATVPRMLPRCTTWELDLMYKLFARRIRPGSHLHIATALRRSGGHPSCRRGRHLAARTQARSSRHGGNGSSDSAGRDARLWSLDSFRRTQWRSPTRRVGRR